MDMSTETHETLHTAAGKAPAATSAFGTNVRMAKAMDHFRAAAFERKPEGICAAYQALRNVADGMRIGELLRLVGEATRQDAPTLIVSAYSHRQCFMCDRGTVSCDHCGGSGELAVGRPCPRCDGIGLSACGFCGGTGWADRNSIPPEIISAVLARQLTRTRRDLRHLVQRAGRLTPKGLRLLDTAHKKDMGAWMMRLQARLLDLAQSEAADEAEEVRLGALAGGINDCLDILRKTG